MCVCVCACACARACVHACVGVCVFTFFTLKLLSNFSRNPEAKTSSLKSGKYLGPYGVPLEFSKDVCKIICFCLPLAQACISLHISLLITDCKLLTKLLALYLEFSLSLYFKIIF